MCASKFAKKRSARLSTPRKNRVMRRAVSALGILLALAWMPASALLCFAERGEDASARLMLTASVQSKTTKTKTADKHRDTPTSKTNPHDRVIQAVSESLDTPPAVHFDVGAFVVGAEVEYFAPLEHAPPPICPDVQRVSSVLLPSNASSRGPPSSPKHPLPLGEGRRERAVSRTRGEGSAP